MESTASSGTSPIEKASVADDPVQPIDDQYQDAEKNYESKSLKFWTIMTGLYLSNFLVALDRTIIATAIPRITDEFHSIADIGCKCDGIDFRHTSKYSRNHPIPCHRYS